ncbi:MAG TPA: EFR1 family ferrodoxin [Lachnospiraceae bacterium]|nr:EFR1 family ferrodoxin [Lachnospiraceae bacterium]
MMMRKVIYYFTGTGNSLRAAKKIAERLGDTELISMRNPPEEVSAKEYDVIGFIYPVYHWTMPEPVVQFVEKLSMNKNAYVFVVTMPSFVNGHASEKLEEILKKKEIMISYGAKVNGVANYVIVYSPMPSPKWVVPRTERKISKIAEEIANRKVKKIPRASAYIRKKYPKVMPSYKVLQVYADIPFTVSKACISCGLCSRVCPVENISIVDGKPTFLHHCAQCMACVCYCPKRAIGYKISKEDMEQLNDIAENVSVIKLMGLPDKRTLYHNPYITAADLTKNHFVIEKNQRN